MSMATLELCYAVSANTSRLKNISERHWILQRRLETDKVRPRLM